MLSPYKFSFWVYQTVGTNGQLALRNGEFQEATVFTDIVETTQYGYREFILTPAKTNPDIAFKFDTGTAINDVILADRVSCKIHNV